MSVEGNLKCWGDNLDGQSNPYDDGDAIQVSVGNFHTCILKSNGNVKCWGNNDYSQSDYYNGGNATQVSAGTYHTCILKSNGNVECWGRNDCWGYYCGQSNHYNNGDAIQVSAGGWHTCILKSNDNVYCWGYNYSGQSNPYNGGDAIQVSAGGYHTCILKSNGNVECRGYNSDGQSNPYNDGDAIQVSAGGYHTCILKSNGNVECRGRGYEDHPTPYNGGDATQVSAGESNTCVLKSNGNVYCWAYDDYSQSDPYNGGNAIEMSTGGYHTCAITYLNKDITLTNLSEGPHNITIYCKDSAGIIGQSDYIYFTVKLRELLNINLTKGWNLISLPINPANNSIKSLFKNINFSSVFTYNGTWLYYYNETNNNFNTIDKTKAYWINSLNSQTLIIGGTEFDYPVNISLKKGWNLISCPSLNESLINETLKDVNYPLVYTYNGTWLSYAPSRDFNTLKYFVPGYGYWVNSRENTTLAFDYEGK